MSASLLVFNLVLHLMFDHVVVLSDFCLFRFNYFVYLLLVIIISTRFLSLVTMFLHISICYKFLVMLQVVFLFGNWRCFGMCGQCLFKISSFIGRDFFDVSWPTCADCLSFYWTQLVFSRGVKFFDGYLLIAL